MYFKPQGLGVCEFALKYGDDDEGWEKAETLFRQMDETKARAIIEPVMEAARDSA